MPKTKMLYALMDEYRRATIDLKAILSKISQTDFELVRDLETKDEDCRSIQTITRHVVQSGYTYANYIYSVFSKEWLEYEEQIKSPAVGIEEIEKMLDYTHESLKDKYDKPLEEIESWEFNVRWGVHYDLEQLLEHAIVHILRHRRQIENFLKINLH